MQNTNIYDKIHTALSWKRILTFNVLLFLITVVPISVRLAQQDTENRSSAAEVIVPEVVPPAAYPKLAPSIERVTEWFGKKGDTVIILGKNLGNYQWQSKLFIGNVETTESNIVRWSDSIIEAQIPEGARTGKVWVVVNGKQANWEGSLLLTDVNRSAQITLSKANQTLGLVNLRNSAGVIRGMIEFSHVAEPLTFEVRRGNITNIVQAVDSLGKKTKVEFALDKPLGSSVTEIIKVKHPGIGGVEILRTELFDTSNKLVPVYAEPLSVKID